MQAFLTCILSINHQKMQTRWEGKHYWRVFSLWINRQCRINKNASIADLYSLYKSSENADKMRMQAVLKGFLSMNQQTMQTRWEGKHYGMVFSLWINRQCRQDQNASSIEGFSLYESTDNADNMRRQALLKGFLSMNQQIMQNRYECKHCWPVFSR
jgi:hypothetical protein